MNRESGPHLHRHQQERIVNSAMNHHSLRQVATAWLTIVTLIGAPAISTGHFVCFKGMPQAGASCPRCHGGAAPDNSCCKWMDPASTTAVHVAGPTLSPPSALGFTAIAAMPAVQELASTQSVTLLTASPPGGSPSQTTILRL